MKTLYITDLDGTLLDANSQVSAEAVEVLNPMLDNGLLFTVATARTPATVVPMLSQLHTRLPFIVLNGAATWDSQKGDYSHVNVIPQATVEAVCAVYRRHGLNPLIYRRHGSIIHAHHQGTLSAQEQQFVDERQGLALKKFILNSPDYLHSPDEAMLIFSMQDYERLRPIYEEVTATIQCSAVFYHDIFDPSAGLLEIYAPAVSNPFPKDAPFDYDIVALFTPSGVKSLLESFPDFDQEKNGVLLACMGTKTIEEVKNSGLRLDITTSPECPSMAAAIAKYLEEQKKAKK